MKITLKTESINYDSIIDMAIPLLKEKAKSDDSFVLKTISGILSMPGDIPKKMLSTLPQEKKDEIVAYLVNNNKERIIELIQNTLESKGIVLKLEDIEISM